MPAFHTRAEVQAQAPHARQLAGGMVQSRCTNGSYERLRMRSTCRRRSFSAASPLIQSGPAVTAGRHKRPRSDLAKLLGKAVEVWYERLSRGIPIVGPRG